MLRPRKAGWCKFLYGTNRLTRRLYHLMLERILSRDSHLAGSETRLRSNASKNNSSKNAFAEKDGKRCIRRTARPRRARDPRLAQGQGFQLWRRSQSRRMAGCCPPGRSHPSTGRGIAVAPRGRRGRRNQADRRKWSRTKVPAAHGRRDISWRARGHETARVSLSLIVPSCH